MQVLNPTRQAMYTGIVNAFSRIATTEGALSLWRGVNSVVIGAGPAHALYFATYEQCKEMFGGNVATERHHLMATAAAGACATLVHDSLMNPFDGMFYLPFLFLYLFCVNIGFNGFFEAGRNGRERELK